MEMQNQKKDKVKLKIIFDFLNIKNPAISK